MARSTSIEERTRIMELSRQGFSDPEISSQMDFSASTVRKWRRRGQRGGKSALVPTVRDGASKDWTIE